jgi:hypothetical protein
MAAPGVQRSVTFICNGGETVILDPEQAAMFAMTRNLLADCEGPLDPVRVGYDAEHVRVALRWANRPCPEAVASICDEDLAFCYRVLAVAHYLCAPLPGAPPEAHLFYHHVKVHTKDLFRGKGEPAIIAMHRAPAPVATASVQ